MQIIRENDERVDELEVYLAANYPLVEMPLKHRFSPGIYVREIFMKAGTLLTSGVHQTIHPFTISKGKVLVSIDGEDWVMLEAGHTGITQAGTRRILHIVEDCIWCTYHALPSITGEEENWSDRAKEELALAIVEEITEARDNSLLGIKILNNVLYPKEKELVNV